MQEMLEHYGKFVLDAVVVAALMTFLFVLMSDENGNKGLYDMIGAQIKLNSVDYRAYTDFKDVYKTESEKEAPCIYFEGHGLEVGVHALSNYIIAVDYSGNRLPVKIKSIVAPDKTELLEVYNSVTSEVHFSQTGVYTITVFAIDENNRFTDAHIQIPINHRKRSI